MHAQQCIWWFWLFGFDGILTQIKIYKLSTIFLFQMLRLSLNLSPRTSREILTNQFIFVSMNLQQQQKELFFIVSPLLAPLHLQIQNIYQIMQSKKPIQSTNKKYTFGHHELFDFVPIQALGEGSYGAVFKCHSKKLARFFAVKKSKLDIERPEVGIMKDLNIEGFCPNYLTVMNQFFQFNVMELCHGTISWAKTFLNQSSKLIILAEVAEILSQMHELHAYHGDIKQNNLLFKVSEDSFRVFISDFGLSKKFQEREPNQEKKQAMAFLRLVHKMAGVDTEYFPTTIIWEQFQPACMKKGMKLKTHWKQIFSYLLPTDSEEIPPMKQIAKLVRTLAEGLAKIVPTNFQNLFVLLGETETRNDVVFESNEKITFPDTVFKNQRSKYVEITPAKTDLPSQENQKSPQKPNRRSRFNKKLPKNLWKADKKRKLKFSQKKEFYVCPVCEKKVDKKNTRHRKICLPQ